MYPWPRSATPWPTSTTSTPTAPAWPPTSHPSSTVPIPPTPLPWAAPHTSHTAPPALPHAVPLQPSPSIESSSNSNDITFDNFHGALFWPTFDPPVTLAFDGTFDKPNKLYLSTDDPATNGPPTSTSSRSAASRNPSSSTSLRYIGSSIQAFEYTNIYNAHIATSYDGFTSIHSSGSRQSRSQLSSTSSTHSQCSSTSCSYFTDNFHNGNGTNSCPLRRRNRPQSRLPPNDLISLVANHLVLTAHFQLHHNNHHRLLIIKNLLHWATLPRNSLSLCARSNNSSSNFFLNHIDSNNFITYPSSTAPRMASTGSHLSRTYVLCNGNTKTYVAQPDAFSTTTQSDHETSDHLGSSPPPSPPRHPFPPAPPSQQAVHPGLNPFTPQRCYYSEISTIGFYPQWHFSNSPRLHVSTL